MHQSVESEFVQLIRERYEPEGEMRFADEQNLLFLLNAPEQYEVEPEMLKYAKEHPRSTMRELIDYFHSIVPDGLPPCAEFWGDEENRMRVRYIGETDPPYVTHGQIYKTVDIEEGWYRIKDDAGRMNDLYPPELFEIVGAGWEDEK